MKVCGKAKQAWEPTGRQNASLLQPQPQLRDLLHKIQKPEFCLTKQDTEGKPPLSQATT